ncbi:ribbon-helix-helix protein, CopG family, partial [Coprobacillus sp. AM29-13]
MDRLDEMTKTDDSKSRSEFIERAIKFYDGYNRSTLENQYLPVAISSAVQGTVKSSED